jgi:hypothetical protein
MLSLYMDLHIPVSSRSLATAYVRTMEQFPMCYQHQTPYPILFTAVTAVTAAYNYLNHTFDLGVTNSIIN